MAYDFHYTPTGTGVISGKEVLEQTEDAINDLGNTAISGVQEALDKAEQALTNSENAVDDAQTALNTANNAEGVAIQAQTDVGNLSGTVTNIGNRVTTAEGNISNLQGRTTTAEGNITNLQGRMTTAETNIGNLQTAVSTAQATANSAQQTATTARQQSYVFRYSGTAVVPNSTIAYSTIDNTDNIKSGDKILDVDGKLFEITAVDTTNQTVTVGSALIDLALDANVVHTSGNETISGEKNFNDLQIVGYGTQYKGSRNAYILPEFSAGYSGLSITTLSYPQTLKIGNFVLDANNKPSLDTSKGYIQIATGENNGVNACTLEARNSTSSSLGTSANKWSKIYGTEYYYGSNNVEFSTKFVTTDTAQTISGAKTFSSNVNVYNSDSATDIAQLVLKNQKAEKGGSSSESQIIYFTDNSTRALATIRSSVGSNGQSILGLRADNTDSNNNVVYTGFYINSYKDGTKIILPITNGDTNFGTSTSKWKSFNGVEPSSLSLPSGNVSDAIDISSYLVNLDGTDNTYIAPANGWISITMSNCSGIQAYITGLWGHQIVRPTVGGVRFFMPVLKNQTVTLTIHGGTIDNARFIPCQGNI